MEAKQAAKGKWAGILRQLCVPDEFLTKKHGPCPMCGGKDRYRFTDHDGDGMYVCNQCGPGDGFDLLMNVNGWDFATAAKEVALVVGMVKSEPVRKVDPTKRLRAIQRTAKKPGAAVNAYLFSRGLSVLPPGLMQGTDGYYEDGKQVGVFDVMLGKVVSRDNTPLTWHVTYLSNGAKAKVSSPKKIMKARGDINGGAIRLWPVFEHIGIAEGIETAIAAYELYGIPTWAVMNATCMERFAVPDGVKRVTIFADNDETYTGQKAAYALANKLVVIAGIRTDVVIPDEPGTDFLDQLNKTTIARRA